MTGAAAIEPDVEPGLVTCRTTGRPCEEREQLDRWADLVDQAWGPSFPDASMVDTAAALLPGIGCPVGDLREGPHWRISLGPGVVAVGTRDYAKADRREEKELRRHQIDTDLRVSWFLEEGEWPKVPEPTRVIYEWSRESRARMVRRLCELDYGPLYADESGQRHGRLPALVTTTYPGDWITVAPNGKAVKRHLKAFRKRYERAWGEPLAAVWKLEFQRRGAPHIHLLMTPPHGRDTVTDLPFRQWLSRTWADVVDHPNPEEKARHILAGTGVDFAEGLRAKDPKRVAVYFLKHNVAGDKEYQHGVPKEWQEPGKGPGRFWGYWTLKPKTATVEVAPDDAIAAARVMRRWSKAQGRVQPKTVMRVEQATGRVRFRRSRSRVVLVGRSRGWVAVNDGPAFAADLARYLDLRRPT